jgi:hypothetical protein
VAMGDKEWCKACQDLSALHAGTSSDGATTLRDALGHLDLLMQSAPWRARNRYVLIPEAELREEADLHAGAIDDGTLAWPKFPLGIAKATQSLAVQIRSVDSLLRTADSKYNRISADPEVDWRCATADAFVIHTRRQRDLGTFAGDRLGYRGRSEGLCRSRELQALTSATLGLDGSAT